MGQSVGGGYHDNRAKERACKVRVVSVAINEISGKILEFSSDGSMNGFLPRAVNG